MSCCAAWSIYSYYRLTDRPTDRQTDRPAVAVVFISIAQPAPAAAPSHRHTVTPSHCRRTVAPPYLLYILLHSIVIIHSYNNYSYIYNSPLHIFRIPVSHTMITISTASASPPPPPPPSYRSYPLLSSPLLSYPILSYPILSYPILSLPHQPHPAPHSNSVYSS